MFFIDLKEPDIPIQIFSYLNHRDLINVQCVCKTWRNWSIYESVRLRLPQVLYFKYAAAGLTQLYGFVQGHEQVSLNMDWPTVATVAIPTDMDKVI